MALYRRAAKRDDNEPECAAAARELGASWEPVSGKGIPDGLVGFRGETLLLEVKRKGGKLTPAQVAFRKRWKGRPPITVTTADDVRAALLGHRVELSRALRSAHLASNIEQPPRCDRCWGDGYSECRCVEAESAPVQHAPGDNVGSFEEPARVAGTCVSCLSRPSCYAAPTTTLAMVAAGMTGRCDQYVAPEIAA